MTGSSNSMKQSNQTKGFWEYKEDLTIPFLGVDAARVMYPLRNEVTVGNNIAGLLFPFRGMIKNAMNSKCLAFVPNKKLTRIWVYPYMRFREEGIREKSLHFFQLKVHDRMGVLNDLYGEIKDIGQIRVSQSLVTPDREGFLDMVVDTSVVSIENAYRQEPDYKGDYDEKNKQYVKTMHGLLGHKIMKKLGDEATGYRFYKHGHWKGDFPIDISFGSTIRVILTDLINEKHNNKWNLPEGSRISDVLKCGYASCLYTFDIQNQMLDMEFYGGKDQFLCAFYFQLKEGEGALYQASSVLRNLGIDLRGEFLGGIPEKTYWISYGNILTKESRKHLSDVDNYVERLSLAARRKDTNDMQNVRKDFNIYIKNEVSSVVKGTASDKKDKLLTVNTEVVPHVGPQQRSKEITDDSVLPQ